MSEKGSPVSVNGTDSARSPQAEKTMENDGPYKIETLTAHEIEIAIEDRHYQVTGASLKKLNDFSVTLKLSWATPEGFDKFYISDLNLARSKSRHEFVSEAKDLLFISEDLLKADLFTLMKALEKLQRENIARLETERTALRKTFVMKEEEERKAIEYLSKHDVLTECLFRDLEKLGYAGDELGKMVLYLAATSRKLAKPLSVLSVANSSAGKSFSQEVISSLIPPDEVFSYTRLSPKSLSHYGRYDLVAKLFVIDEFVGMEDESAFQIRALLSKGSMVTAYASVDPQTGKVSTLEREVCGPISLFTSTTHEELIDDETRTRFLILPVDESREQTQRVMKSMTARNTEKGILGDGERNMIRKKYQVIQKVLKSLPVAVPEEWAPKIEFNADKVSNKRKFEGYFSVVNSIALHRQYQKEKKISRDPVSGKEIEMIFVEKKDIELANSVMENLFAQSQGELNPVNQNMLGGIETYCKEKSKDTGLPLHEVPFTRREVREFLHWEHVPCRRAFEKLFEMEYIERSYGHERARHYYRLSLDESGKPKGAAGLRLWTPS